MTTPNADHILATQQHRSRLKETDPTYLRLRDATARRLSLSLQRLVRELRGAHQTTNQTEQHTALSEFITRQTQILQDAYIASYQAGASDYFGEVSNTPGVWAKRTPVDPERMRRALAFYAPSIAKMAHQALAAVSAAPGVKLEELIAEADNTIKLGFGGFHVAEIGGARGGLGGLGNFNSLHQRWGNGEFRPMGIHSHHADAQEHGGGQAHESKGAAARKLAKSPNEHATQKAEREGWFGPGLANRTTLMRKWNTQHETYKAYVNREGSHEQELQRTAFKLEGLVRRGWGPGTKQYDEAASHFAETKKAMQTERRAAAKASAKPKAAASKAAPKTPAKAKLPREATAYHSARRQYQTVAKRLASAQTQMTNTQRSLWRLEARKNLKPADHERITQLRAKVQDRENQAYKLQLAHGEARTRLFEARRTYLDKQMGYKLAGGEQDVRRLYTLFGGPRQAHQAIHDIVRPGAGEEVHIGWNGDTKHGISVNFEGKTHDIKFEVARLSAKRRAAYGGSLFVHDPNVESHGKNVNGGREIIHALNAMRQHGVSFIRTGGSRDATHNGYDTWAKLGAEGLIPKSVRAAAAARFGRGVHRVEQIMDKPGGARWWREHGDSWNLRMRLSPGGRTAAKLDQLLARASRSEALGEPADYGVLLAELSDDVGAIQLGFFGGFSRVTSGMRGALGGVGEDANHTLYSAHGHHFAGRAPGEHNEANIHEHLAAQHHGEGAGGGGRRLARPNEGARRIEREASHEDAIRHYNRARQDLIKAQRETAGVREHVEAERTKFVEIQAAHSALTHELRARQVDLNHNVQWIGSAMHYQEARNHLEIVEHQARPALRHLEDAEVELTIAREALNLHRIGRQIENTGPHSQQELTHLLGRDAEARLWVMSGGGRTGKLEYAATGHHKVEVTFTGPQHELNMTLHHNANGELVVNEVLVRSTAKTADSGLRLLKTLNTFRHTGVAEIDSLAAKGESYNGYDTWARLGAEGHMPTPVMRAARAHFNNPHITRVEHVIDQRGGAAWWKANGTEFAATMNLRPGGRTALKLDELLARLEASGRSIGDE